MRIGSKVSSRLPFVLRTRPSSLGNVSIVADPAKSFLVVMKDGRMPEDTRPR